MDPSIDSQTLSHQTTYSLHLLPPSTIFTVTTYSLIQPTRHKTMMSEHSSIDDEIDLDSTVTHIRNEINFIHAETYHARKALIETLSDFTNRFEAIDGRLNRIEQLLLDRTASKEQNNNDEKPADEVNVKGEPDEEPTKENQTIHKWGRGGYVREDVDETNTKTIANSKPERAKRAIKQPVRYVPEAKKSRKDKAAEVRDEEGSDSDDRPVNSKKRKASEPEAGKAPAAPTKRVKVL